MIEGHLQAGSRYEFDETYGVSHFLRAMSNSTGKEYSGFIKTNVLAKHGGYITCKSDRQHICYTLRCPPALFTDFKYYFLDVTNNMFHHWEIEDRRSVVIEDLSRLSAGELVMDLIQSASFSGGLSNSIYCRKNNVGCVSQEVMKQFRNMYFGASECCVASVGMPFEETIELADNIEVRTHSTDRRETCSSHRNGYETRNLGHTDCTMMAFAVPGVGSMDLKSLVLHGLLAATCGTAPFQISDHLDLFMEGPLGNMCDIYTNYKAFNISYLDVGIFGITVSTPARSAKAAAEKAIDFLQKRISTITCSQIEVGKRRLKLDLSMYQQNCVNHAEALAYELACGECVDSWIDMNALIDNITPEEVMAVAQGIQWRVPMLSYAAVGDLRYAPIDQDIMCNL